jgi:mannose-6-phosphate isomerase-like protein (cupin superfamily)
MPFDTAVVGRPTDKRRGRTARGDEIRIVATSSDTGGSIGIFDGVIAPGTGPDWHIHSRETEVFHVVTGNFRFWCGDDEFEAGPGTTVTLPPHVPHQWKNVGTEPGLVLTFVAPGGFEQHFLEIAALGDVTDEAMAAIDAKYGVRDGR